MAKRITQLALSLVLTGLIWGMLGSVSPRWITAESLDYIVSVLLGCSVCCVLYLVVDLIRHL